MKRRRTVRSVWILTLCVCLAAPACARYRYFVPDPSDSSLRSKCRSEASMIGGGGKSAAVHLEEIRQLRHAYVQDCMKPR